MAAGATSFHQFEEALHRDGGNVTLHGFLAGLGLGKFERAVEETTGMNSIDDIIAYTSDIDDFEELVQVHGMKRPQLKKLFAAIMQAAAAAHEAATEASDEAASVPESDPPIWVEAVAESLDEVSLAPESSSSGWVEAVNIEGASEEPSICSGLELQDSDGALSESWVDASGTMLSSAASDVLDALDATCAEADEAGEHGVESYLLTPRASVEKGALVEEGAAGEEEAVQALGSTVDDAALVGFLASIGLSAFEQPIKDVTGLATLRDIVEHAGAREDFLELVRGYGMKKLQLRKLVAAVQAQRTATAHRHVGAAPPGLAAATVSKPDCGAKRQGLARLTGQASAAVQPPPAAGKAVEALCGGDFDVRIALNVGGQVMKASHSTLTQFKDSVLAEIVRSCKASPAAEIHGSELFLDVDPVAFREILSFLRLRLLDTTSPSVLSGRAASLANYLGIPVDHVLGTRHMKLEMPRKGEEFGHGLVFEVYLPPPANGSITALHFSSKDMANCKVYTKLGKYAGALAAPDAWTSVWDGQLEPGMNTAPVNLKIGPGETHSIYLWVSRVCLAYSDEPCEAEHTLVRELGDCSKGYDLVCTPGRCLSVTPFGWPSSFQQEASSKDDLRFFAGEIMYTSATPV